MEDSGVEALVTRARGRVRVINNFRPDLVSIPAVTHPYAHVQEDKNGMVGRVAR